MIREINKNPEPPILSELVIELLTNLCFKEDSPRPSDLIFVFGSNIMHTKVANVIESLLDQNLSKKVIITGGIADYNGSVFKPVPESVLIHSKININRFQDVEFILEKKSKNNLENVNYAADTLRSCNVASLICLSHSYASYRSSQTLRNIYNGRVFSFPYDVSLSPTGRLITAKNWWKLAEGKSIVWGEFLRIRNYGRRGDFQLSDEMISLLNQLEEIESIKEGLSS